MRIASRIRALFIPMLILPVGFVGFSSWFAAQDGITAVARELLTLKLQEVLRVAATQHSLLVENGLENDRTFREAAEGAVADHAASLQRSESEDIFAIGPGGVLVFSGGVVDASGVAELAGNPPPSGWSRFSVSGQERVGVVGEFEPFGWIVIASEAERAFFGPATRIARQTAIAGGISVLVVLVIVALASRLITAPLGQAVRAMNKVIKDGDLDTRITSAMNDETGQLADSFNHMTLSLSDAYQDIKRYALNAAYAERREFKIRTVFQRYVPQQVIDKFFENPESMLIGEERKLTVLYSDIREFTKFSENLTSREVVESLNRYFKLMVSVISTNSGIVDKFIGDAIMAFFGAPAPNDYSARDAVMSAMQMLDALDEFNRGQTAAGKPPFKIGIAINHGPVTVGNIGSDQKMDYTVIGDMVNVASRVEGLTKLYRQPILITESVRRYVRGVFPVRMVDRVQVKGRQRGLAIWAAQSSVSEDEARGWKQYHAALLSYYNREFTTAQAQIEQAIKLLPGDYLCELFTERISRRIAEPPAQGWTGVVKLETK